MDEERRRRDQVMREALARKYPTMEEAREIVGRAGLDPIRIAFHARADLNWFAILGEAEKQGEQAVRTLLDLALEQYPDDTLRRLRDGAAVRFTEGPDVNRLGWRGRGGQTLEKILGKRSTLVPVTFLEVGMQRARAVARLRCADGSFGTGFLIPGDLLVTNHHVLEDEGAARGAVAQFNYQKTVDGHDAPAEDLPLAPASCFVTSEEEDCTIVAVEGEPARRWGVIELEPAVVRVDDRVNIIQHPGGERKQLSFFHNLVAYVGEGRVQYLTDTLPGSSGSPVFDKDWRLVALHHSGGWIPEPGSRDRFIRNEGIHVDRLIDLLRRGR